MNKKEQETLSYLHEQMADVDADRASLKADIVATVGRLLGFMSTDELRRWWWELSDKANDKANEYE